MTEIRRLQASDFEHWRELFLEYSAFYEVTQTEESIARTWSWLVDPDHVVTGLVAEQRGRIVGFAHYRTFPDPLEATTGCFLDDLFVAPDARGSGAARALLDELARLASQQGWSVVRWITADDNHRARTLYDRVAERTMWVTYDLTPAQRPGD